MHKELQAFFEKAKSVSLRADEHVRMKGMVLKALRLTPVRIDGDERQYVWMQNQQFIQTARSAVLQSHEKAIVKERLQEYMRMYPIQMPVERQMHWLDVLMHPLGSRLVPLTAGFLALITITSGSFAYAAESALPGDWLYSFKVHVNENVWSGLSLSEEERIRWEARRAQRRLEELEDLYAENRLPDLVTQDLVDKFHARSNKVRDRILVLRARGDTEKAAALELQFQSAIEAHQAILHQLSQTEEAANVPMEDLVQQLHVVIQGLPSAPRNAQAEETETVRQKGPAAAAMPARLSRRAAVEQVRAAKARVRQMNGTISDEESRKLEARVALMEKKLDEALDLNESAVIGETLDMVRTILRDTTHAERMVQLKKKGLSVKGV